MIALICKLIRLYIVTGRWVTLDPLPFDTERGTWPPYGNAWFDSADRFIISVKRQGIFLQYAIQV